MPGTRPRVALNEDVLASGASGADGVDGGLVELADERVVHVVVLVVGVEDDELVVRVPRRHLGPPRAEARRVADHLLVVPPEVVRVHHRVRAPVRLVSPVSLSFCLFFYFPAVYPSARPPRLSWWYGWFR